MGRSSHATRPRRRLHAIRIGVRAAVVAVALVATQTGCVAIGLSLFGVAAGLGGGTAVSYTMNGYAYRTFTAPLPVVERAALRTIHEMGFKLESKENGKDSTRLVRASGNERNVEVRLERVTDKTTRIRTVVSQGAFLRDKATATEIIIQTEQVLGRG
jgi:Protein of unknown function (DUF3568)